MVTSREIFQSNIERRNELILRETRSLDGMVSEIDKSREISRVINTFLPDYFRLCLEQDNNREDGSILLETNLIEAFDHEIKLFKSLAIAELKDSISTQEALLKSSKNVYEMSGAVKLAFANNATRNLSTTMGHLWERLASVSPYAINPESEFNIKIKGIDLIVLNFHSAEIEYQQLKTQHNTLTGSQKPRSVEELQVHKNPVFCACFANNSSWTFNHPDIPRVSGNDFWSRIGISYEIVLSNVKKLVLDLEKEYIALL